MWYYNVYQSLTGSRNASMAGALPIPVTAIQAYCEFFYIVQLDERERIFRYVNCLDNTYLSIAAERSKSNSAK